MQEGSYFSLSPRVHDTGFSPPHVGGVDDIVMDQTRHMDHLGYFRYLLLTSKQQAGENKQSKLIKSEGVIATDFKGRREKSLG